MSSIVIPILELNARDRNSLTSSCVRCSPHQHCCTRANTIVVLPNERLELLEQTGKVDAFAPLTANLYRLNKVGGEPCPFSARDRSCSVYEHRPTDCRIWPVGFILSHGRELSARFDATCAGVQHDAVSAEFVEIARKELRRFSPVQLEEYLSIVASEYDYYPMREAMPEEIASDVDMQRLPAFGGAQYGY